MIKSHIFSNNLWLRKHESRYEFLYIMLIDKRRCYFEKCLNIIFHLTIRIQIIDMTKKINCWEFKQFIVQKKKKTRTFFSLIEKTSNFTEFCRIEIESNRNMNELSSWLSMRIDFTPKVGIDSFDSSSIRTIPRRKRDERLKKKWKSS